MSIEIYLLEQLESIVRYGTLSAASEALHLTQPTLTRSMQKLEQEIGAPVFDRKKNRIFLNENGQIAMDYAKRILALEAEMIREISLLEKNRNTVSFGSNAPSPIWEIAPYLSDFFSGKRTTYEVKGNEELLEGLGIDRYQLICINSPVEDDRLLCTKIMSERLYFCFIPDGKTERKEGVFFKDITDSDILLFDGIGFWKERILAQIPGSNIILIKDNEKLNLIAQHSDFAVFSSNIAIQHNVRHPRRIAIPVKDEGAYTEYYCVCKKDNSAMAKFLKSLAYILPDRSSE